MSIQRRILSSLAAVAVALAPSLALACPVCAGRETNTTMIATLLGLMIAVPYAIAVVVIRVVRATERESAWITDDVQLPSAPAKAAQL